MSVCGKDHGRVRRMRRSIDAGDHIESSAYVGARDGQLLLLALDQQALSPSSGGASSPTATGAVTLTSPTSPRRRVSGDPLASTSARSVNVGGARTAVLQPPQAQVGAFS